MSSTAENLDRKISEALGLARIPVNAEGKIVEEITLHGMFLNSPFHHFTVVDTDLLGLVCII